MGAGKTTVGRILGQRLGWKFIDLDDRIRVTEGRDIAEIFHDLGEAHFRRAETEALRHVASEIESQPGCVLAVGGGAFAQAVNVAMLRELGARVVFLDAPWQELRRRCTAAAAQRPLLGDENQFRQLYESRLQGYMAADLRMDTYAKTPAHVAHEIARSLGLAQL